MAWKNNYEDPKTHEKFYKTLKNGKVVYAKRYRDKNDNDGKSQWTPFFDSPKKVLEYIVIKKSKTESYSIQRRSSEKHKFVDVFEQCLEGLREEYIRDERSPSTIVAFKGNIYKYVIGNKQHKITYENIKDMYIEDMVVQDIKNLKNSIINKYRDEITISTMSHIFSYIDKVFNYARDLGFVTNTFCTDIYVSPKGKKRVSKQAVRNFLSEKEYNLFRKKFKDNYKEIFSENVLQRNGVSADKIDMFVNFRYLMYNAFFSAAFYTGERKCGVRGLRWTDLIPPSDGFPLYQIKFDSQYNEAGAKELRMKVYDRKPKTTSSVRICTVHQQLQEDLEVYKNFLIEYDLYDENNYMFYDFFTATPKPIPKTNISRIFNKLIELTNIEDNSIVLNGIKRKITLHGLRHSACALLLEKGMEIDDVAKFLGHSDTSMVKLVYSHYINPIDMEEEAKMRNLKFFMK